MEEELGFPFDVDYLEKLDLFLDPQEGSPQEVVVWVESKDDIRLWQRVLKDNRSFTFDFRPASMFCGPDGKRANGCNRLIKLWKSGEIQSGFRSIFCLDSDFKYLAGLSGIYNGENYNIPHFYWTLVHSKEHVFVCSEMVDDIISHAACIPRSKLQQNTAGIYSSLSRAIYSSFVRLVYLRSSCFESPSPLVAELGSRLDSAIQLLFKKPQGLFAVSECDIWSDFVGRLELLSRDLSRHLTELELNDEFALFEARISAEGVSPENIYLFYRGHDWYELSFGIAKSYLGALNKNIIDSIKISSVDPGRDIKEHNNQTPKIREAFLCAMPSVEDFPFFKKTVKTLRSSYSE
ncbi:DUF4435 domain-containing protein [Pseudomonas entomophila]|uniref:DUF4435 domain-containing protein n=1 Tax=Pseudomonas entomophila TaxID=312306 RepID=UPI0015E393F7|nr:DUF4435 domain-containing protein [Pseudomonas entomophila]MBA1187977.1 DUF4435 domain-containing protein [Pseudomonas entomophila]